MQLSSNSARARRRRRAGGGAPRRVSSRAVAALQPGIVENLRARAHELVGRSSAALDGFQAAGAALRALFAPAAGSGAALQVWGGGGGVAAGRSLLAA